MSFYKCKIKTLVEGFFYGKNNNLYVWCEKMFLIVVLFIVASIIVWSETMSGKIVLGCTILAIGAVLLSWIMGIALLLKIAKLCLIIIVITIVLGIFISIMKS